MDAGEDTLARTRWRGPVLLGLGVGLCTVGVLSACGGPMVVPYRAPDTPVVALEPLKDGEVVVAAAASNSILVEPGQEVLVYVLPGLGSGESDLSGAWSVGGALGLRRMELRAGYSRNLQGNMLEAGLGLKLKRFGAWTPLVDVATAFQDIEDEYTQDVDTAAGVFEEVDLDYRYRVRAPSARVRMVWQPSDSLSVPLSLRVTRSSTVAVRGLEGEMPRATYVDVGAGVVYRPGDGCLRLGAGLGVEATQPTVPQVQVSLGCRAQLWGGAQ